MKELHRALGWRFVPVLTDREPRFTDPGRAHVPTETIKHMAEAGDLAILNKFMGRLYAVKESELTTALASHDYSMLDLSIQFVNKLASQRCAKIVLLPESEHQLVAQISAAGRKDDTLEIIADYRQNYLARKETELQIVVNFQHQVKKTANQIAKTAFELCQKLSANLSSSL